MRQPRGHQSESALLPQTREVRQVGACHVIQRQMIGENDENMGASLGGECEDEEKEQKPQG